MKSADQSVASSEPRSSGRYERLTSHAKIEAVLRLLKGESVETVSHELDVPVPRIERWKNRFIQAGSAELAKRKNESSSGWLAKHSSSIWQWTWLLLALVTIICFLAMFTQRSPQD